MTFLTTNVESMTAHKVSSREAEGADEEKLGRCNTGNPSDLSLFRALEADDVVGRAGALDNLGTTTIDF